MSNGTAIAQRPQARAYLAGGGLSLVLIAGAVAVFLALGAFVAFNGLPFGGHGDNAGHVTLRAQARAAAANAGAALGGVPGAVAGVPGGAAAGAPAGPGGGAAGPGGGPGGGGPAGGPANTAGGGQQPLPLPPGGGTGPGGTTGGGGTPGTPPPPAADNGIVGGTINNVDDAAGNLGLHTNLGGATGPITKPVDGAVNGVVNGVGHIVGGN
jgi:hypothetical protein